MKTFETNRLIIRPFEIQDAKTVQQLAGVRAIADTTINIPHPYEDGMAEKWIASHPNLFETGQEHAFAIIDKHAGSLIGAISLISITKGHQAELGYWIGLPFWGQGFCTEAACAIFQYAFIDLALQRIHACYLSRNEASGRVMQKLGMKRAIVKCSG